MLRLVTIAVLQSVFLAGGQVFLKLSMESLGVFSWTWEWFKKALINWPLYCCGGSFVFAVLLYFNMLKNYDFSVAYPITSISYIFGMAAALFVFHETIPLTRWIGVVLIVIGVVFLVK